MDDREVRKAAYGWDEKAANLINGVMVTAIGLAFGALGVWALWQVDAPQTGHRVEQSLSWQHLLLAVCSVGVAIRTLRFGWKMLRGVAR